MTPRCQGRLNFRPAIFSAPPLLSGSTAVSISPLHFLQNVFSIASPEPLRVHLQLTAISSSCAAPWWLPGLEIASVQRQLMADAAAATKRATRSWIARIDREHAVDREQRLQAGG